MLPLDRPVSPPFLDLQVTKRTSMPVKFWLFENYLSPSFKTIAAAMAQVRTPLSLAYLI